MNIQVGINRTLLSWISALLLAMGIVAPAAFAQCLDYPVTGMDPGAIEFSLFPDGEIADLVMDGNTGWIAQSFYGALVSVDFTDPDRPVVLGSERVLVMDETYDVDVSGGLGFLTYIQWGGPAGVRIFDITAPTDPLDIGNFQAPDGNWASYLAARDSLLYVSFSYTTFGILDVSDGSAPVMIGQVAVDHPWEITLDGDLAYVATETQPVIIDISDPTDPVIVGTLQTTSTPNKIAIQGSLAYISTDTGLEIFDVTNPAAPQPVGSIGTPPYASYLDVSGDIAYLSVREVGTHIFDVSNPAEPILSGLIEFPQIQWGTVKEQNGRLHVMGLSRLYIVPPQCPPGATGVESEVPGSALRLTAWPNPFNPRTVIEFELPAAALATLEIHDLAGRRVRTLVSWESLPAGGHQRLWRGLDDHGNALPSGVYLYRVRAGAHTETRRVTLIR